MAVTLYRSSDGSAPGAYSNTVSSLITILDACLVNGYGAKVAAGWTKAFTGTNKAAYRNSTTPPSTGFYFRVDDTSTSCQMWIREPMLFRLIYKFPVVCICRKVQRLQRG